MLLWEVNRVFSMVTTMHCIWVCTPVEQLQPFEWGHTVDLWEAGWTYRRIVTHVGHNVSVICHCFQQWSVEYSHIHRRGSGWPHSTDARQDWCIVRAAVAAWTASREEIQAHVAPVVSPGTIGNCLLAAGLRSCVPLAGYHLHHNTAKRSYSGVIKEPTGEWNDTL